MIDRIEKELFGAILESKMKSEIPKCFFILPNLVRSQKFYFILIYKIFFYFMLIWTKKNLDRKKNCIEKKFWIEKKLDRKNFGSKNVGSKKKKLDRKKKKLY